MNSYINNFVMKAHGNLKQLLMVLGATHAGIELEQRGFIVGVF